MWTSALGVRRKLQVKTGKQAVPFRQALSKHVSTFRTRSYGSLKGSLRVFRAAVRPSLTAQPQQQATPGTWLQSQPLLPCRGACQALRWKFQQPGLRPCGSRCPEGVLVFPDFLLTAGLRHPPVSELLLTSVALLSTLLGAE